MWETSNTEHLTWEKQVLAIASCAVYGVPLKRKPVVRPWYPQIQWRVCYMRARARDAHPAELVLSTNLEATRRRSERLGFIQYSAIIVPSVQVERITCRFKALTTNFRRLWTTIFPIHTKYCSSRHLSPMLLPRRRAVIIIINIAIFETWSQLIQISKRTNDFSPRT